MADQAIRLGEEVIIASCGVKKAGSVVTESECGESWQWILSQIPHEVLSEGDVEAVEAAQESSVEEPETTEVTTEVTPEAIETPAVPVLQTEEQSAAIDKLKTLLCDSKLRLNDIVEQSGVSEDIVSSVLTESNGFRKNQQGWWGLIKS